MVAPTQLQDGMIQTTLGEVPLRDLDVRTPPQPETEDVWIIARECYYKGDAFPEHKGTLVRRDVWVTVKRGQSAAGKGGL